MFGIMAVLLVLMISTVYAANEIRVDTVAEGDTICGSALRINFTTTESEVLNVSIRSLPISSVATAYNTTANQTNWSVVFITTAASDGAYKLNITQYAATGDISGNNTVDVTIDNTAPVFTFDGLSTKNNDFTYSEDFIVRGTTNEASATALTISINKKLYTMSGSGTSWSRQFAVNELPDGSYPYTVITGADSTTCANTGGRSDRFVNIYTKKPGAVIANQQDTTQQQQAQVVAAQAADDNNTIIIVVIVAVVGLYLYNERKAKRR